MAMSAIIPILAGLSAFALGILILAARADRKRQQQIADQQWRNVEGEH
jgi:hypothetical protein